MSFGDYAVHLKLYVTPCHAKVTVYTQHIDIGLFVQTFLSLYCNIFEQRVDKKNYTSLQHFKQSLNILERTSCKVDVQICMTQFC